MRPPEPADIAIIGAGAAGLMAAISAARAAGPSLDIVALDSARTLGAKILVAGGGRCNVTHHQVRPDDFAGASRNAIAKVLRQFTVEQTIEFFRERGVTLKREDTGKLFPTTDAARTILDALLGAARDARVAIVHPWRVESVERDGDAFHIRGADGAITARRVIIATGGRSLPKSGSDGHGYTIVRALGHTTTERIFPALVPLTLPKDHFLCALSGLTLPAALEVRASTGKRLARFEDSLLCAHFGLSGPAALNISRYWTDARRDDPGATLIINWLPGESFDSADALLAGEQKRACATLLRERLPERLARALCDEAGVDASAPPASLPRERRRALARLLVETPAPVTGDRGYTHAEVTAGGVPLTEIHLATMESRICPGLHLCGEICDVDGRIGGFNFQWAWASGHAAGAAAALALVGA
jgi:predicted Rossmann fold flavoprotein